LAAAVLSDVLRLHRLERGHAGTVRRHGKRGNAWCTRSSLNVQQTAYLLHNAESRCISRSNQNTGVEARVGYDTSSISRRLCKPLGGL
jgi:hypothetical protein